MAADGLWRLDPGTICQEKRALTVLRVDASRDSH